MLVNKFLAIVFSPRFVDLMSFFSPCIMFRTQLISCWTNRQSLFLFHFHYHVPSITVLVSYVSSKWLISYRRETPPGFMLCPFHQLCRFKNFSVKLSSNFAISSNLGFLLQIFYICSESLPMEKGFISSSLSLSLSLSSVGGAVASLPLPSPPSPPPPLAASPLPPPPPLKTFFTSSHLF